MPTIRPVTRSAYRSVLIVLLLTMPRRRRCPARATCVSFGRPAGDDVSPALPVQGPAPAAAPCDATSRVGEPSFTIVYPKTGRCQMSWPEKPVPDRRTRGFFAGGPLRWAAGARWLGVATPWKHGARWICVPLAENEAGGGRALRPYSPRMPSSETLAHGPPLTSERATKRTYRPSAGSHVTSFGKVAGRPSRRDCTAGADGWQEKSGGGKEARRVVRCVGGALPAGRNAADVTRGRTRPAVAHGPIPGRPSGPTSG